MRPSACPASMNITFDGVEAETLLLLDEAGICASAGSACSAGAVEPSHVLLALGLTPAQAGVHLRRWMPPWHGRNQRHRCAVITAPQYSACAMACGKAFALFSVRCPAGPVYGTMQALTPTD